MATAADQKVREQAGGSEGLPGSLRGSSLKKRWKTGEWQEGGGRKPVSELKQLLHWQLKDFWVNQVFFCN